MGLLDRYRLKKRIKREYNSFFTEQNPWFTRLEIIPDHIQDQVEEIYKILKKYPKVYNNEIKKYEDYVKAVKNHNKEVKYIKNTIDDFDYNAIIKNPIKYNFSSISRYVKAANLLEKYRSMDKQYLDLKKKILSINNNIEGLKLQYKLLTEYKEIQKLFNVDCYIDKIRREKIYTKIGEFVDKLKQTGEVKFYDFSVIDNIGAYIDSKNEEYINHHLTDEVLNNINGKSLDEEQRRAVIQDENSSLTIAGAGSGKTLTICGKVKYLIEKQGINPKDILLLSYSKKSADDLDEKISRINENLTVGTFHKIGLDILSEVKHKKFMIEEQYDAIIEEYFRKDMVNYPNTQEKILRYYSLFLSNNRSKKYRDKGELYSDLSKSDFKTLREQLLSMSNNVGEHETIKHERVKSFEEMAIANFYFINGIDYEYEKPYEYEVDTSTKRQYRPDFYLTKYKLYHEHYGIDENGEARQFKGKEAIEYISTMKWKQALHAQNSTKCLETYSYEFNEGTVFQKLEKGLKSRGIKFSPLKGKQISEALNSIYNGHTFKSFIKLVKSFINLYKAKYTNDKGFEALKKYTYQNKFEEMRGALFLDIVKDIYTYYMNHIRSSGEIDFDDMILQSLECLEKTDNFKYKYIIVDEFQDISFSRMRFLLKLINHGNAKLFAVGDDWQAIYRFSGCDLGIFLNFDNYFGKSRINYITSTHRNSQELQDIAGPFITANKDQFNKTIKSNKHLNKPIQIVYYEDNKYNAFFHIIRTIKNKNEKANILLLGRNNFDIDELLNENLYRDHHNKDIIHSKIYPGLKMKYSTVHSAKGLEEDYVILINANDERNGFPNKVEDDPLLNLVLSNKSQFEFAEERRLWYVALTRTKNYIYIIANHNNPSMFVKEILDDCFVINPEGVHQGKIQNNITCPSCKSGRLILREKNNKQFYGCSNYPYCNYTNHNIEAVNLNKRCRICGDFLVMRKNKNGKFYGCYNYPKCTYTEQINYFSRNVKK